MRQIKVLTEANIFKGIRFAVALISLGVFTAAIGQTLSIDMGTDLGPVKHVATGFLKAFSKDGINPPPEISKPLKIKYARYDGWNPSLNTRFLAEGVPIENHQVVLYGQSWSNGPSVNNYADYEAFLVTKVNMFKSRNLHPQYDIWNEPDSPTYWKWSWAIFLETWRRGYLKIKQTDPQALICGGSFAYNGPTTAKFRGWLEYCKANNVVPDYITWHFPGNYVADVAECRRLISTMGLTSVRGIIINEFIHGATEYTGILMHAIGQLERSGVDGAMHACWDDCVGPDVKGCTNGSMNGILVLGKPTGKYYLYERYARISGRVLKTVPSNKMEIFAAKDSASGIVSAIFGGPENHAILL